MYDTYMHTIHADTYTCIHTDMCSCIYTFVRTYIHIHTYIYIHTCMHACTYVRTYMHAYTSLVEKSSILHDDILVDTTYKVVSFPKVHFKLK